MFYEDNSCFLIIFYFGHYFQRSSFKNGPSPNRWHKNIDQIRNWFELNQRYFTTYLVVIDISYPQLDICCKHKDSLASKIYYFMANPFSINEDYHCHVEDTNNITRQNDTATFDNIGPINLQFNEVVYPSCDVGRLGFNKRS